MNNTMHFDVHPPTGKLLLTLFGYFVGYDGKFQFSSPGLDFGTAKYTGIRKVICSKLTQDMC
ncbi:hypothetical protein MXB_4347 [Myxobolus squamalis]|nr:hypothetical protein MXB_4347 [Myxobolus squamalis]